MDQHLPKLIFRKIKFAKKKIILQRTFETFDEDQHCLDRSVDRHHRDHLHHHHRLSNLTKQIITINSRTFLLLPSSPYLSNISFFFGSDKISYASAISLNFSSAPLSLFLSGGYFNALKFDTNKGQILK